mgnify:CR=1 FL=1
MALKPMGNISLPSSNLIFYVSMQSSFLYLKVKVHNRNRINLYIFSLGYIKKGLEN